MMSNDLHDLRDVEPRNESDEACIAELRAVLEKHNALSRFGVCLLHDHFEVDDTEILEETHDPVARTLMAKPMDRATASSRGMIETMWHLGTGRAIQGCMPFVA